MKKIITLLFAITFATSANAANAWKIIPQKSKIEFRAIQGKSDVSGSFTKFDGEIFFDPQQLNTSKINITINTTSIKTSFSAALEKLRESSWLAINAFPQANFKSEKFSAIDGKKYFRSEGILTIKEKSAPVILDFVLNEYSQTTAHISGKATIKRSTFGIGDADPKKADDVLDEVIVMVDVVAQR